MKTTEITEGQHQGMERPVTVVAAAHCRRQKTMDSYHRRAGCGGAQYNCQKINGWTDLEYTVLLQLDSGTRFWPNMAGAVLVNRLTI